MENGRRRAPARVSGEFVTPHYLRFVVRDRPGIIARIAGVMEQHDINIDAVLQLPYPTKEALPFVVTVEACPPSVVAEAVRQIGARFPRAAAGGSARAERNPPVSGTAGRPQRRG